MMYTRPSIRDEFLHVLYGMVTIQFRTVSDRRDTADSSASTENFGTFIQESRHRPFDQIKILEFTYSDESATGEDSSRNSQLVEALQHFAGFGCHLRYFVLKLGLAGKDDKFPDLDSWRTKLLGGTAIVDALCTLHVTKKIIILVSDGKLQNKGVELIAKMAEEVATRKRWYSFGDNWADVSEDRHGCDWFLQPFMN